MEIKKIVNDVREAQKKYANFTQEQVDKIFKAVATACNENRIPLAQMAVEESRMGNWEDKITKNHFASENIYNKYKDLKTCGVFEEDLGIGIEKIYEPMGVVAAIIPTTNPTSTTIFKCLLALKTRNGIVISAHPRAWNSTIAAARIILETAVKHGAPEGIVSWLPQGVPLNATNELMAECDVILATGGSGMVKAAYSSGTPAIGVGPGNCPAIIDDTANIKMAAASIIQSNMFDNGVVCSTENEVIVVDSVYNQFCKQIEAYGAYIVRDKKDVQKIKNKMFKEGAWGFINPDIVGQTPQRLGEVFGINVPASAKILLVEADSHDYENPLTHEKLCTMASLYKAKNFDEALDMQYHMLQLGAGHTSSVWLDEFKAKDKLDKFKLRANSGRMLVNTPSSVGSIGDLYNFGLNPTLTIGCGSWGGNMFSENVTPKNLLNIKTVAKRRENMMSYNIPSKVFYKFGATRDALKVLKEDNDVKKAFVVTDDVIWGLHGKTIREILDNLDIKYQVFSEVEPNPSLATCRRGAQVCETFEPDAIIAFGGGSAMDAAKMMWVFYEKPDANFHDISMRFLDIWKRINRFPAMGKKAKLCCIPTTAGTGSEVTPFAVITDEKTHIKYPLADFALTPNMAIVDAQFMLGLPKGMTAATGLDALTHDIEAIASLLAADFTDPIALKSIKLLWDNLPEVVKDGQNAEARQNVANAATMAGVAFSNAFLGIVHSLSHKIGGHLGVIHGLANAIYLPHVIYYNSQTGVREKQGYFSQYQYPQSIERYAMIADTIGLGGKTNEEKTDRLIVAIQKLTKQLGCPISTSEYGVKDEDFYKVLDQMSVEAYDDQCTGANPRIPLIKHLKGLYINAHHGVKIPSLANPDKKEYAEYNKEVTINTKEPQVAEKQVPSKPATTKKPTAKKTTKK